MAEKESKNKWHTPAERIMMLGFAAVILLGTILLCLPVSAADGKSVYWLDALFTATTSVCVTGLVTVPTATTWSTFGKIVILGLIQFGGLGIMACLTMVFLILRRKISLQSRKLIQDTYNLPVLKGSVGIVRKLLIGTAAVELAGAFFYSFWFVPEYGFWKGIGYSLFHSVSAFCNAGIDLVGESSFAPFVTNPLINFTTMGLIFLSGLGFPVWWEVLERVQDLVKGKRTRKNLRARLHAPHQTGSDDNRHSSVRRGASDPRAGLEQRILAWQLKTGAEGYGGLLPVRDDANRRL